MPSKRRPTRTAQLQPQPAQSDYDTDTAIAPDITSTAVAPPPKRTNTELNLAVLRRYSPTVQNIIAIAPFAVVYTFVPETQLWEKCGMEGTLFVCELRGLAYPQYNVMILNRKSLDNFITELHSPDDVEVTDEYVILQVLSDDGIPQIFGLWIFEDEDGPQSTRNVVAEAIQRCANQALQGRILAEEGASIHHDVDGGSNLDGATSRHFGHEDTNGQPEDTNGQPNPPERQLDLLKLFGQQAGQHTSQPAGSSISQYHLPQTIDSTSLADVASPGTLRSPGTQQNPVNHSRPLPPQNALLDLFKTSR